ncbi:MAG TPA: hypothetical protein GX702_08275 [Chloroflexi bacterium]|nr:hypothetical protein [Chloroflexota bacterium]
MEWIKKSVWQQGIGIILILIATWLMYLGGSDEPNLILIWIGLGLMFVAMAIPIISRLYPSGRQEEDNDE